MHGMPAPPSVHVVLAPSRRIAVGVCLASVATLVVLVALPLAGWQLFLAGSALAAWAIDAIRTVAWRRGPRAAVELWLAPNRLLAVRGGDGRLRAGHVRGSSRVGALVTTIVWRPDGAWTSRAILLVPDVLPEDEFRRVRVLLRYARSDVAQPRPSSQSTAL